MPHHGTMLLVSPCSNHTIVAVIRGFLAPRVQFCLHVSVMMWVMFYRGQGCGMRGLLNGGKGVRRFVLAAYQ